jgi:M6 family metalloprotease-like protein
LRDLALTPDETARIIALLPSAAVLIEKDSEWEGELQILVEDDFQHQRSRTRWRVRASDGTYELFFGKKGAPSRSAMGGMRVRVKGISIRGIVAVEQLLAQAPAPTACSTTGPQNIAYLMATMPGGPAFPASFTSSFFQQTAFGTSGITLNNYWKESSYGLTSATGQVFGPFALSQSYTCDQSDALEAAVLQAAAGSVNFTQFNRVAVVFPVSECTFGGLGTLGCQTLSNNQFGSFAWFPIFSYESTYNMPAVIAHEHGHNLGLNHSSTADYGAAALGTLDSSGTLSEYGDPFSVMGMTYQSNGGQGILGQYTAEHKVRIGWMQSGKDYQEVSASGTFTVAPFEASSGVRALRIVRDAATGSGIWLEYRQPSGLIDSTFSLMNQPVSNVLTGALIHYDDPNQDSDHTFLIDLNPAATPNNFYDGALTAGQTWTDPYTALRLTVLSATASGLTVSVNYDAQCATAASPTSPMASGGGTASLAITAGNGCAWAASTGDSWLALNGTTSGTGNGSVPYTITANTGGTQRTGYITLLRQSVPLLQMGTGTTVLPASPASGSGASAQITFSFKDPRPGGFSDITTAYIDMEGTPGCHVYYGAPSFLYLLNDAGTQYTPLSLGVSSASVSNRNCTVLASGSSITGSGQQLTINLHMAFPTAYAGTHRITASVVDGSGTTYGPVPVGSWTVPSATTSGTAGLLFVPITPCRLADTRNATGSFGGPSIAGQTTRSFVIPGSACSIPVTAHAYSLNVAVVPTGTLGYLTVWPTGQSQPLVATLNSDGRVKSNAAIVAAGTGGAVSFFASNTTDVVVDINGYFVSAASGGLAFYPLTPCRVADTRNANGPSGGPFLSGGTSRTIPVQSSPCGVAASAQAYSVNLAAVPRGTLGYLTAWPTGQTRPTTANLNAPTGTVTSNGTIVPAGTGGSFDVFASNDTDLVVDINGYFAPFGTGGLSFYTVTPCRVLDTRLPAGSLPFSGTQTVNVSGSTCAPSATSQAYVLNATVVPPGALGYLTLWAQGATQPVVASLNASDGAVTGNLAIVPTANGSISAFASNPTHLVLDLFGYFAP